jgi:hypothetical protein
MRTGYRRLTNPSSFEPVFHAAVDRLVGHFSVDTPDAEHTVWNSLRKIQCIWQTISKPSPVIAWLIEFSGRAFNLRFGVRYSFGQDPAPLLAVCLRYDEFPLVVAAADVWPTVSLSHFRLSEAEFCFALGEVSAALPFVERHPGALPPSLSQAVAALTFPLPSALSYSDAEIRAEVAPVYGRLRAILDGRAPAEIPRSNVHASERVVAAFGRPDELLEGRAAKRDFAFLLERPLSAADWLDVVFPAVLSSNAWPALWRYLLRIPDAMAVFRVSAEDVYDFLRSHGCHCVLLDLRSQLFPQILYHVPDWNPYRNTTWPISSQFD